MADLSKTIGESIDLIVALSTSIDASMKALPCDGHVKSLQARVKLPLSTHSLQHYICRRKTDQDSEQVLQLLCVPLRELYTESSTTCSTADNLDGEKHWVGATVSGAIVGGVFSGVDLSLIWLLQDIAEQVASCKAELMSSPTDRLAKSDHHHRHEDVVHQCNTVQSIIAVFMKRYAVGYVKMIIGTLTPFGELGDSNEGEGDLRGFWTLYQRFSRATYHTTLEKCFALVPDELQRQLADVVEAFVALMYPRLALDNLESLGEVLPADAPRAEWDATVSPLLASNVHGYHHIVLVACYLSIKLVLDTRLLSSPHNAPSNQELRLLRALLYLKGKHNVHCDNANDAMLLALVARSTPAHLVSTLARCRQSGRMVVPPTCIELLLLIVNCSFVQARRKLFPAATSLYLPPLAEAVAILLACIRPSAWRQEYRVLLKNMSPVQPSRGSWHLRNPEDNAKANAHHQFKTIEAIIQWVEEEKRSGRRRYRAVRGLGLIRRVANHHKMLELYILRRILWSIPSNTSSPASAFSIQQQSHKLCEDVINEIADFLFGWGHVVSPRNFFKTFSH